MRLRTVLTVVAGAALSAGAAIFGFAQQSRPALAVGDPAPPFSLQGSDGRLHRLSDHLGQRAVVLAWFPKAFTGG